jgi:hypothetical protein
MKQNVHCPNCGARLELTVDVSILGEIKAESEDLAKEKESDISSVPATVQTMNVKKGEQYPTGKEPQSQEGTTSVGILTEYAQDVIYHMLSKAEPDGLSKDELRSLVLEKGVSKDRFEEALGIMSVRAEIYSLKNQKYRITF